MGYDAVQPGQRQPWSILFRCIREHHDGFVILIVMVVKV
jgi:hypothetical protein